MRLGEYLKGKGICMIIFFEKKYFYYVYKRIEDKV